MALIVNGEKIDDSVITEHAELLRPKYEKVFRDQVPDQQQAQLLEWSKENVIEMTLLAQYARENGPEVPEEELQKAIEKIEEVNKKQQEDAKPDAEQKDQLRDTVKKQLKLEKTLEEFYSKLPEPTDRQINDYYNQNKDQYTTAERVRVRHIVKHINWQTTEDQARQAMEKALDELKKGAVFEAVVQKYSDCPENGGDLGYIQRGKMVEEFEDIAFNLSGNQVSDIFRTRFGFHIVKLYDRKPSEVRPLDEVKKGISAVLTEQLKRKALEDFVDDLKAKAKIEEI